MTNLFAILDNEISKRPQFQKALSLAVGEVTLENREQTFASIGKIITDEYSWFFQFVLSPEDMLDLNDYILHLQSLQATYQ